MNLGPMHCEVIKRMIVAHPSWYRATRKGERVALESLHRKRLIGKINTSYFLTPNFIEACRLSGFPIE